MSQEIQNAGSMIIQGQKQQQSPMNRQNNMSIIPTKKSAQTNESIKVCIRVRPLLQHERLQDEAVFYPDTPADSSLQAIRLADGQHYIES